MKVDDIKAALEATLKTIPNFGQRVFADRERPYEDDDLPCAEVEFEAADPERVGDHYLRWYARFTVTVVAKGAESARPDLAAGDLLQLVINKLLANQTLGGVVPDELVLGSFRPEKDAEGERVVRKLVLDVTCPYTDDVYGAAIDDFITAAVEIDTAGPRNDPQVPAEPDGQIDAAVTTTLPQA